MDHDVFEERLREAARRAVCFAREHVRQPLPDAVRVLIRPNQSYDGNPLRGDEEVFPAESLPDGESLGPWSVAQAVAFLWRAGRVPEWIDVAVRAEDGTCSLVELRCCGRFSATDELLYHRPEGIPPFSVKSPCVPPGWQSVEASGHFDLYWQERNLVHHSDAR